MANFPIPYLYENPAFWGDPRDKLYGVDFINLPYQDKNVDNEREMALLKMSEYILYIESKEKALMSQLGVTKIADNGTFSLWDSNFLQNAKAKEARDKIKKRQEEIRNINVEDYYETSLSSIQQITKNTSVKEVSAFILNSLMGQSKNISISQFIPQVLNPISKILYQQHDETEWQYFLETQTKLLSYIIDFFNDKNIPKQIKNTRWYLNNYQIVQDLAAELKKAKLKRDTRKVWGEKTGDTKFSANSKNGTVTINIAELQQSIKGSLHSFKRKGFPKLVEDEVASALGAEHTGSKASSGGTIYNLEYILPEVSFYENKEEKTREEQQLEKMYTEISGFLESSLEHRRTVKSDIYFPDLYEKEKGYGISIKSGQNEITKLDTRSNFYTYINFISQYSPAIAKALLLPQNLHILINNVQADGTFHSDSLNAAVSMIAYAFFGSTSIAEINNQTKYFDEKIGQKYTENVLIINDEGTCTRISTYLRQIYNAIRDNINKEKSSLLLSTTFTSGAKGIEEQKEKPIEPHPSLHQLSKTPEYLKNIAVETYIKTFH